jgi:hypothetical protein
MKRSRFFYYALVNGQPTQYFSTKRAVVALAKRTVRADPNARVSVWFRDVIGQAIPINWREVR